MLLSEVFVVSNGQEPEDHCLHSHRVPDATTVRLGLHHP